MTTSTPFPIREKSESERHLNRYIGYMSDIDSKEWVTKTLVKDARTSLSRLWSRETELMMAGFHNKLCELHGGVHPDHDEPALRLIQDWYFDTSRELAHINSFVKKLDKAFANAEGFSLDAPVFEPIRLHLDKVAWFREQLDRVNDAKNKTATPKEMKEREAAKKEDLIPPATREQIALAQKTMDELVQGFIPELTEDLRKMYVRSKEAVDEKLREMEAKADTSTPRERNLAMSSLRKSAIWQNAACMVYSSKPALNCWHDDWEARAAKSAEMAAKEMGMKFAAKQVEKISALITEENPITSIKANFSTRGGNIEAAVIPHFQSKHSFRMITQVVYSWSNRGTFFARYPTTFHALRREGNLIKQGLSQKEVVDFMTSLSAPKAEADNGMSP